MLGHLSSVQGRFYFGQKQPILTNNEQGVQNSNLVDYPGPDTPLALLILILTIATALSQTLDPTCVRKMRVLRVAVQEQDDSNVYMLHLTF